MENKVQVDKIRVKIWDKNNQNVIIYDNNLMDTGEDTDPITAISAGAIVIHNKKSQARMDYSYTLETKATREIHVFPNPV